MALKIVPCFQKQAKDFIAMNHRHNIPSISAVFQLALEEDGSLVGVAMVGIPKARLLMDGVTLEVTRVCVREGVPNANSMIYGACARAAAALGWQRLVTYTLTTESGSSLKAAGWTRDDEPTKPVVEAWTFHKGLGSVDMFGNERIPQGPKYRWWKYLNGAKP